MVFARNAGEEEETAAFTRKRKKKRVNFVRNVTLKILREPKEKYQGIFTKLIWAWRL